MMSSMVLHLPNTTGTGLKYILTNNLFPKAKITILNKWVGKHWDLYLKYGIGKTIFLPKTNVKKTAILAHSAKRTLHPTTYFCPLVAPWRSHSFSPRKTKHSTNPSHQKWTPRPPFPPEFSRIQKHHFLQNSQRTKCQKFGNLSRIRIFLLNNPSLIIQTG